MFWALNIVKDIFLGQSKFNFCYNWSTHGRRPFFPLNPSSHATLLWVGLRSFAEPILRASLFFYKSTFCVEGRCQAKNQVFGRYRVSFCSFLCIIIHIAKWWVFSSFIGRIKIFGNSIVRARVDLEPYVPESTVILWPRQLLQSFNQIPKFSKVKSGYEVEFVGKVLKIKLE